MTNNPSQDAERERRLDEIATAYLKAIEAGEQPRPEQWLERHPDLADDLKGFFSAQQQLAGFARRRDEPAGETTVGLEAPSAGKALGTVRYFGDYELLAEIARGGMGIVFKAKQVSLNRVVALKMILAGQLASTTDVQRFRAEAEAVANLDHPNIVPIYEVGEFEDQQYFSMKMMEGGSLAEAVGSGAWAAGGKQAQQATARLMVTVARAVQHAHQRGILHRDLKPANILLDKQGLPHVTDFGLAKRVQADQSLSQSGAIVGTPLYMSPEQAAGKKGLTTAADIYSLGAILYQLVAGRPPFTADTPLDVLMQVVEKDPPPLRSINRSIDADLETVCMKCLRKEPGRRYASAEALADDLERWLKGEPIQARPIGSRERLVKWAKRKPAAAALVGVSMAAMLVLTVMVAWFLTVLYERNRALQLAGGQLATERDRAIEEEGKARKAEQLAGEKGAETAQLLDRTQRMLMTTQLLNVGSIYRQNPVGALALLEDPDVCPPQMRDDFAWRFYRSRCQRWRLKWEWEKGEIDALAVSPDGKLLATSKDKVITLWELNTGKRVKALEGHSQTVTRLLFSPDSRMLASGAQQPGPLPGEPSVVHSGPIRKGGEKIKEKEQIGSEVRCWDVDKAEARLQFSVKEKDIATLAFSADCTTLAAGYFPKSVRVWQVESGRETAYLPEMDCFVALSPDGKLLAAGFPSRSPREKRESRVEIWDVDRLEQIQAWPLQGDRFSGVNVVFTRNGKELAANDHGIRFWSRDDGKDQLIRSRVPLLPGVSFILYANQVDRFERHLVAIAPDGKSVASLLSQSNIVVWDVDGRQEQFAIQGTPGEVEDVSFTEAGKSLAVIQRSHAGKTNLRIWSLAPRSEDLAIAKSQGVVFLPKGNDCVTVRGDKLLRIDPHTGREEVLASGLPGQSIVFAAAPDGSAVALASSSTRNITVWDMASKAQRFELSGVFFSFRFSPDSARIVLTGDNGLNLYDAKSGAQLRQLLPKQDKFCVAVFSPDGDTLAIGGKDEPLRLLNLNDERSARTLSKQMYPLQFLRNGNLLAMEFLDDAAINLKLWDPRKDQEIGALGKMDQEQPFFALSEDGKAFAKPSGTDLEVWDLASCQTRLKLPMTELGIVFAFSPDNGLLAYAGFGGGFGSRDIGGTLQIWDTTRTLKEIVIRPGR